VVFFGSSEAERQLARVPTLSTAILSATQGAYTSTQLALDITQGARMSNSAYKPSKPPELSLAAGASDGSGHVAGWAKARTRAGSAPQLLSPGLLAASIPGGGAYVGSTGDTSNGVTAGNATAAGNAVASNSAVAAGRDGAIAAVSLGPPSTILTRIERVRRRHRLVVADLPAGPAGYADLRLLAARRPAGEMLLVLQRQTPDAGSELLWCAAAGLQPGHETLTSQTTNQRGLVAAIDIAPTILAHLGLPVPADMRGKPIRLDGTLRISTLAALKRRLGVLSSRRLAAIRWLVAAWALLLLCARLPFGSTERRRAARATALRVGALAMLWVPVGVLVPAAVEPSRTIEFALLVAVCFVLGALTDRLVAWPRAPAVPALVAVVALSVDALAGTQLLMRSLLGPNPAFGARFYGIGNELKSALAVLVLAGVASVLYPATRGRRAALSMAGAGIALAIVEGSARIGAGVGGVILVSAGTAVAALSLSEGRFDRKRALLVVAAPVIGLVALAAIDLATAHGGGHFTGSVLDARSAGDVRDIIVRRYGAAYDELKNHLMPFATVLALLLSVIGVVRRERLCAPVSSDPAWIAALAGGLTAGVVGALSEDSGPVLLVVAVFVLGCVCGYLWGAPAGLRSHARPRSPDTLPAERSRALTQPAGPAG
jgi:hypothetical protein